MEYRTIVQGLTGKMASKHFNTKDVASDVIVEISGYAKLPAVILLPDSIGTTNPPVAVQQGDFMSELRFKKTVNENQNRHGAIMYMEDRRGELMYSEVHFRIVTCDNLNKPLNAIVCDEDGTVSAGLLTKFASTFLRHFIVSYKQVMTPQKDWIEEISVETCSPWKSLKAQNIDEHAVWQCGVYDNRGTTVLGGNVIPKDKQILLQRGCLAQESNPTATSFMQLANRARERSDWMTHIVFLHTGLEYWVFSEVRTFLLNAGKNIDEVESDLLKNANKPEQGYISKEMALKLIFGNMNFKNTAEYTEYQEKVTKVRSSIIHVKAVKLGKEASDNAAVAFQNFSRYVGAEILRQYHAKGIQNPKPLLSFLHPGATSIYDNDAYPKGR
ncbi:hypothetical protein KUL113_16260 [Tenacibaculum sp. KUL113]|nr:hypothetical protein KUL113_16260 [Tenacibaculum sp. KUL113]